MISQTNFAFVFYSIRSMHDSTVDQYKQLFIYYPFLLLSRSLFRQRKTSTKTIYIIKKKDRSNSTMHVLIVSLVVGLIGLVLVLTGFLRLGIDTLFHLAYCYHKKLRRKQRPGRLFLIRHGESQANVDPSNKTSFQNFFLFIFN